MAEEIMNQEDEVFNLYKNKPAAEDINKSKKETKIQPEEELSGDEKYTSEDEAIQELENHPAKI